MSPKSRKEEKKEVSACGVPGHYINPHDGKGGGGGPSPEEKKPAAPGPAAEFQFQMKKKGEKELLPFGKKGGKIYLYSILTPSGREKEAHSPEKSQKRKALKPNGRL